MNVADLQFPDVRRDLIYYLELVPEIGTFPPNSGRDPEEDLMYLVHFFFDDTELDVDPGGYVGLALVSLDESKMVKGFVTAFRAYLDEVSPGIMPPKIIRNSSWNEVERLAQSTVEILKAAR